MSTVWFTADQHFGHEGIITSCNRPFRTAKQMDKEIIKRYREVVGKDDIVYFIGDFSLKTSEYLTFYRRIMEQLPGTKHLILGNHDSLKPFVYEDLGFQSVHTSLIFRDENLNYFILRHDPGQAYQNTSLFWLCGHVHTAYQTCGNVVNVGIDVCDFYPVSLNIVKHLIDQMEDRK
jgi:calcineurin-like phosphoesterase family protein